MRGLAMRGNGAMSIEAIVASVLSQVAEAHQEKMLAPENPALDPEVDGMLCAAEQLGHEMVNPRTYTIHGEVRTSWVCKKCWDKVGVVHGEWTIYARACEDPCDGEGCLACRVRLPYKDYEWLHGCVKGLQP